MRCAFSLFLLMVSFLVWPSSSPAFDYNECVASGKGTNQEKIGYKEWRKYDLKERKRACARIYDEVTAEDILRGEQMRTERERAKQTDCAQSGECSSSADIQEQIRRSKQENTKR